VDVKNFSFRDWEREDTDWKVLLSLLVFAFLLRLPLLFSPEVIHNDGIEYIRHAKLILSGDWSGGKAPPLYPALVAFAHLFVPDAERAGILISIVFGSVLILPAFYLGKEMFNARVGLLSALFAVVHPFLNISSGSVLTESTYYFLFATSVLFGWYAFTKARFSHILLFSFFTTLAYLTRPEAIGVPIVFSAWTLFTNPPNGERRFVKRIGIILIASISFLIFSFPYLYQIRKDTGAWGISKKATLSVGSLSGEEEAPSFGKLRGEKGLTFSSLIKHPWPVLGRIGAGFLDSLYKFLQGLNPILFFLAVIGWVLLFRGENVYPWKGNFFLLAHLIFYFAFVFPFFFITKRYTSQMVSISIPWAAFGFLEGIHWINQRFNRKGVGKRVSVALLICLLIGLFVQGRVVHSRERRLIQKEVGLWMKDHLPRDAEIMSRLPQEAFYAQLPWVRMPDGTYEVIIGEARTKGVRYLAVEKDIEKVSPRFWEALRREDIVPVKEFERKDQRETIFELVGLR
jgi:4-amino-4-deoxy-L-arabinose transferase-like glycosyltransferase